MKYKNMIANLLLFGFLIGSLLTFSLQNNYITTIIHSFFLAGFIAGFADWFGVTALFRNPISVPEGMYQLMKIRTNIIANKRKELFSAIIHLVEGNLFSKENLKTKVNTVDTTAYLLKFLIQHNGKQDLFYLGRELLEGFIKNVDVDDLSGMIETQTKMALNRVQLTPIVIELVEETLRNGYDDRIVHFCIDELDRMMKTPVVKDGLSQVIEGAIENYGKGNPLRKMMVGFIIEKGLKTTLDEMAAQAQQILIQQVNQLHDPHHELRLKLKESLYEKLTLLKENPETRQRMEGWKMRMAEDLSMKQALSTMLQNFRANLMEEINVHRNQQLNDSNSTKILNYLEGQFDLFLNEFEADQIKRKQLNLRIQKQLQKWINAYHGHISTLVYANLNQYTNDELVKLIEDKAGNDLQSIRIVGTIGGGLLGILLGSLHYLFNLWFG